EIFCLLLYEFYRNVMLTRRKQILINIAASIEFVFHRNWRNVINLIVQSLISKPKKDRVHPAPPNARVGRGNSFRRADSAARMARAPVARTLKYFFARPPRLTVLSPIQELTRPFPSRRDRVV